MTRVNADVTALSSLTDAGSRLVEAALAAGADAADVRMSRSQSTGVDIRNGKVEESEGAETNSFSLRVFIGQKIASVSSNIHADVHTLAERAVAMARVSPANEFSGLANSDEMVTQIQDLDLSDADPVDFGTMREQALASEAAALAVDGVSRSGGSGFSQTRAALVLVTSGGFVGAYETSRYALSVTAIAGEGTGMERDYDFSAARHLEDLRSAQDIGQRAGQRAVASLGQKQMPTGQGTIVFEPRVAKSLVGHILGAANGASIARKTSFLRNNLEQSIAPDNITIIDDPLRPRGLASRPFDGEGVECTELDIVRNGVLSNWLLDSASARELGLKTNGRAARSGNSAMPSASNVRLLPGMRSQQDHIGDIENGILVTQLIGQGVDLVTGAYSRGASGFRIENGKITHPVGAITIASKLQDMFANMQPADDVDDEGSTSAPSIVVGGMTIAGN